MQGDEHILPPGFNPTAPNISTIRVNVCPICGNNTRSSFGQGFDYELQTCSNNWHFHQCTACTAVWLDPRPTSDELSVIYPSSYYAYAISDKLSPIILKGKMLLDRMKFSSILNVLGRAPKSFLDVGCGDGRYLYWFEQNGVPKEQIFGIELVSPAVSKLRAAGFQVFAERVEDCKEIPSNSVDLITMFHVIEHVEDPVAVLAQLTKWLTPGGVLALETPNIDSMDLRVFRRTWWGGYHIPRHWTLFNETSLKRALRQVGLEPVQVRYQTGHSFWLYSFHHLLKFNKRWPVPRFAQMFDPMRSRVALVLFTAFDIVRRTLGARTSAILILARKAP
jgi:2-polyprenyl-3-methyl-5-hydroxy-6-metoxy-1,4-benzoquinol methylase